MTSAVAPRVSTVAPARPRLALVAAAVLILLWTVHTVASWAGGYERVPWATLEHEQGRMTAVTLATAHPSPPGPWWTAGEPDPVVSGATEGQPVVVVYTVADGQRVRVADPAYGAYGPPSLTRGASSLDPGTDLESIGRGLPEVGGPGAPIAWWVSAVTGGVLALGTLLLVVAGPRPVHGNRWFWFWILQAPAGLGVLAYAVYELGGRGRRRALAAPERREGGGWGFVRLISAYVVLSVVGGLLAMLLGVSVTPL